MLAIESEQLLRDEAAPSEDALADANVARRAVASPILPGITRHW